MQIGASCEIGPNVVIGEGVRIGDHCVIKNSTVMSGCVIEDGAVIKESIVGWNNRVLKGARLLRTYTGDDVTVKSNVCLEDYHIAPNKSVGESNPVVKKVILCCVSLNKPSYDTVSISFTRRSSRFLVSRSYSILFL